jgi:F-type H+-transporting ATPase subunit delta
MEDASALARPYGLAAFKQAQEEGKIEQWSEMLHLRVLILQDAIMRGLVANPKVNDEQLAGLVIDVAGDGLTKTGQNLVRILAENERLTEMAGVAAVFEQERDRIEGRSHVEVTSAFELTDKQQKSIGESMSKRLGTEVDVSVTVDKSLIGGVIIRAGDTVIDASLRGRLGQLGQSLTRRKRWVMHEFSYQGLGNGTFGG